MLLDCVIYKIIDMKVKIIKCSTSSYWYYTKIGFEYEVIEGEEYYLLKNNMRRSILKVDCEVINEKCEIIKDFDKWKKGDLLISDTMMISVIYTGKNKKDESLFEGFVMYSSSVEWEPTNYQRHFDRKSFKANL